jgi:hypothetical protein
MAKNDQNESALPVPGQNNKITASDFLPKFFRTQANKKFLQGTLDQLIQPGVAEKINGYYGRTTAKAYKTTDNYVDDVTTDRTNYQLEPATVIKDNYDNVTFYKDYNDYIGQLNVFGAKTANHSRLNSQETYAWNPNIDWDKFVNFREYYWLPNGPISIPVRGQSRDIVSTYTVTTEDQGDNIAYVFNDGLTRNPNLKLYRGQTYRFEIDAPGHPMAIAISRTFTPGSAILTAGTEGLRASGLFDAVLYGNEYDQGEYIILPSGGSVTFAADDNVSTLYPDGIRKLGEEGEEVAVAYIEKGTIEFTIPFNAPDRLFYISKNAVDTSGQFRIYDIEENAFLNVEEEILGKKTYLSANGVELSNGMKIRFQGDVLPVEYETNDWYVEGVGTKITLIKDQDLIIPAAYSSNKQIAFDSDNFDTLPFSDASAYASEKDYIVVNRASLDRNAWSRYNRWHHKDVIIKSFELNQLPINVDELTRAKRPIIEFEAGLKLNNFGAVAKKDVDLIDTFTTDVFSVIEGQSGYNIDGIDLADNMRILFTADTDLLVSGKIYQVKFVKIGNNRQISLIETADTTPVDLETVLVTQGVKNAGKSYHYHNNQWILAQEKTTRNQPPMFAVCDVNGNSFSDEKYYGSTTFKGTKLFSYAEGEGTVDTELGFALSYKSINNSGDIVFDFNLLRDIFTYQTDTELFTQQINNGYLKKYTSLTNFSYVNGFSSTPTISKQYVIKEYAATDIQNNNFKIDVYNNSSSINDLKVVVFVNNKLQLYTTDYTIDKTEADAIIKFNKDLDVDDIIKIKTDSKTIKNSNGYYEFPYNLERNPLNDDINQFTLGEVIEHVDSMLEDIPGYTGNYLGASNLRDLGDLDKYGKRFVKHSGPINLPLYHVTNKSYNIIKALKYSKQEYSRFKKTFLDTASNLGYDGVTKTHVDLILREINKDKLKSQPFYFSDMTASRASNKIEYTVLDARTNDYPITNSFNLKELSSTSVLVYLNGTQLTHIKDYNFNIPGYVSISAGQVQNDIIEIHEYATTDGSFIPPTPTKLGLYPKYYPELTIDDTVQGIEPNTTGPFKIYGEDSATGTRGWFYPVYTTKSAAGPGAASKSYTFTGMNKLFYMPTTGATLAGNDDIEIDEYPIGVAFIRGHDGSYVKAYKDFRDELLLELEKRIFNNIKAEYSTDRMDVNSFIGGEFRINEFTKTEIDDTLLGNFTQWIQQNLNNQSYTNNTFYDRNNNWSFNYSDTTSPNDNENPGFWRSIYVKAFDTDRPHSHPWEMLGLTTKPKWWNTVYGPAPYTGDNLVLWKDLEEGRIADPLNTRIDLNYVRPGLTNFIPVDSTGKLLSPLDSRYVKNFQLSSSTKNFKFGDYSPVETAWRRSSEYPFAVLTAMTLNQPAKTMGLGFDVSRTSKNLANQWVDTETNKPIVIKDLKLPNTFESSVRTNTSGLVNYIYNLVASDILTVYDGYKTELQSITNQIGLKIAGFTSKEKFNLILDSRSPTQELTQDGIFVPQENYQVFLNTSSPNELAIYSGIIIERTELGYVIRGYNLEKPYFEYYEPYTGSTGPTVTVGGISEKVVEWDSDTSYISGEVLLHNNAYYRVINSFTSSRTFDTDNIVKLPALPLTGGKTAKFKRDFDTTQLKELQYGSRINTAQEVVDFILGYGVRQKEIGFSFEAVSKDTNTVENWSQSAKEFLFWTTQGWSESALITISPGANLLEFARDYYVVDNIKDDFYGYNIFKADGLFLDAEFNSLLREQNSFGIEVVGTDEGLYHASLPLVQKEHVILLDNITDFNDNIYNPTTGYRQDRIRVNGYRSDNWNGGLNIPGFVYDDARFTDWSQWKDYVIGDIVKYKQYYYVATANVTGSQNFNSNNWYQLNEKPTSQLMTNFDYRVTQFTDFYDLDSDSFDVEQQKMAQHLIGYQKRQYLANIINDDVSQFKFYRGAIADKGTMNVFTKLFDALGNTADNLDFYEEWAIQVGRYGAVDDIQQVEYNLQQEKMQESPQAVELVNTLPATNFDKIYRILPNEVFDKPADYTHAPLPTKTLTNEYIRTSGYTNEDDVDYVVNNLLDLSAVDTNQIGLGDTIWITDTDNKSWTVMQLIRANVNVLSINSDITEIAVNGLQLVEITLDKWATGVFTVGEYIGIRGATQYSINGLYEVDSINLNTARIRVPLDNEITDFEDELFAVSKLRNIRVSSVLEINSAISQDLYSKQKLWIDTYNSDWAVLENTSVYENSQNIVNPSLYDSTDQGFSDSVAATKNNNNVFVSSPNDLNGKVSVYRRTREQNNLILDQEITLDDAVRWKENTLYLIDTKIIYTTNNIPKYYISTEQHTSSESFEDDLASSKWTLTDSPAEYFDITDSDFGRSIAVSPDGEYLVVGIPQASNVKTRLAYKTDASTGLSTFDFQPDATYIKNDIVRYRESLWKVNREILPEIANQPFSTFDTYVNIASSADADSTTLNLLVAGDPGLNNSNITHLLVRAPRDMYIGTTAGDTLNLFWNRRSYAYPTLDVFLPFDNKITQITPEWLSQDHTIVEKIDHIFFVDTFVSLPEVGDIVTTDTGAAEVFYVGTRKDSAVIYVKDTNGVFAITGELFINELSFVGFYTEESTYSTTDAVDGFWYINTGEKDETGTLISGFEYSNNGTYYDPGRGLVYADIRTNTDIDLLTPGIQLRDLNKYYNIQDTVGAIGSYVTNKNQASFISNLSYRGDPSGADGIGGTEEEQLTNKWIARVGRTFSDNLTVPALTEFRLYNLDNRVVDVAGAGFTYDILNKQQTIVDLWDGYIDFELTEFDFEGFAYEPQVGDIVEDVQIPRDGQGGLALTSITTSSAEVMFMQRKFNNIRVYLKIISGEWLEQSNIGRFQIRRKSGNNNTVNPNIRGGVTDVDRTIGIVTDINNSIVLGNSLVGKLIVFTNDIVFETGPTAGTTNFPVVNNPAITDEEYWFFDETQEDGVQRFSNPPYSLNKDYTQIYNIPADKFGTEISLNNEGAVAIYRRLRDGTYRYQHTFISEYRTANRYFGSKVAIVQTGNYYTLLVGTDSVVLPGDDSTERRVHPGSIEIFRHGTKSTDSFKGEYQLAAYQIGDIVIYKDDYYICRKATTATQNVILDPIYWNKISWQHGKDSNYRGDFDNSYTYKSGSIVVQDNKLWKATTNIAVGATIPSVSNNSWTRISTDVDYLGYLPNLTANAFFNEDVFDPAENILEFSKSFDISTDAQVLIVTSKQHEADLDSTVNTKIAIYREIGNKFQLDQVITAPDNVTAWADKVSLSPDGTQIAVSSMLVDTNKINQGVVYIYTQQADGKFGLLDTDGITRIANQTLTPPQNEESEGFGFGLDFGTDNLAVSSLNGDQTIPTIFDVHSTLLELQPQVGIDDDDNPVLSSYVLDNASNVSTVNTTFDNGFTNFANIKLDKGVVYVYETINNSLIYSEQFRYPLTQTTFGENIYTNGNHVYIGMPDQVNNSTKGQLLDFRKNKNTFAWKVISEGITPVDVDNIRGAFLYNKRENRIVSYIDYIDPVQGKIAGPADQEITFKTPFDPAVYNTGNTADSLVDPNRAWTDKHTGQVWWNINSAKFEYAYQSSTTFQKNAWNKLTPGARIDVFEWVESNFIPSIWDSIADTPDGIAAKISGTSLYGDTKYSTKITYDEVSKTFGNKYYFWVVNKVTVPVMENRRLSIRDIAALIENPRTQGYPFLSLLSSNKFVLNNFDTFIDNNDLVLNIKYSTGPKKTQNLHSQYKLISDGLNTSRPDPDIERKWFDSLIGFDDNNRIVPDPTITVKNRYGVQNRPRQSMFVNRFEALKQTIERINLKLSENLIVDEYDISKLSIKDEVPTLISQEYDTAIDTLSELTFVSTNKVSPAILTPIITNGRISRVNITDAGRGYKVAPSFKINGEGKGAEFNVNINNLGQIISVDITNAGSGYNSATSITVRPFTVLVNSDSNIQNKWALYSWDGTESSWYRRKLQSYNVDLYWDYVDWYADGFNQFTNITDTIQGSYLLPSLDDNIGDIVKIENVGTGGWLLLQKIDNQDSEDYTINYNTIGRENGTIQFKDLLYDYSKNTVGFDNRSFDSNFYDNNPSVELRIILETIRDNIFVGELATEYNQLFMAALRYVMSEQQSVDWMFKTSFVKAKHNRESLSQQDITFNNDNLTSYKKFVEEFKPYSTKIREFVSQYTAIDSTNTSISDFDLPPTYNNVNKTFEASNAKIVDGEIVDETFDTSVYPRKNWKDNIGYKINEVKIRNSGSGFTFEPIVTLIGGGGTGATAKAYLGYGKITSIKVTNPGSGYTSAPTVVISGSQLETGTPAKATAILGNGVVRSPRVKIKFDRTSGTFTFDTLAKTETFTGTGFENRFFLEWPMDLALKKVSVYVDNILQLRSKYTYENIENLDKSYAREQGKILFATPPKLNAIIRVEYNIPLSMLNAEDRIKFAYNPIAGMYGKDLAQLMTGVDYGGVEVRSFDFDGPAGFDTAGWYTDQWDEFDNTFEDEIFTADGSTIAVQLSAVLEDGVVYNLYKNGVRIDDPNFDAGTPTNVNAITNSITGDGVTDTIFVQDLGIELNDGDVFVVRKTTSDGSVIPDLESYDTALSGGDLAYTSARGIAAEEIIVDGDGFVTPTTSAGPEEVVPGQVLDTLDIKVYTRDSAGQGVINSQSYIMDSALTYDLGVTPSSKDAVIVKVANVILPQTEYTINWAANTVTLNSATLGAELNIVTVAQGTQNILDFGQLVGDGSTTEFETTVDWETNASVYASINGVQQTVVAFKSETGPKTVIRFEEVVVEDAIINYTVFSANEQVNYSQITKDTFTGNGTNAVFTLANAPLYAIPSEHNVIVKVDNKILNAGYNVQYTIPENSQREYPLEIFQMPAGSLDVADLKVFLNGTAINTPLQWRFEIANSSITLADEVGAPGDLLEIYVITDGDYRINGTTVTLDTAPVNGAVVEVIQFTNHNLLGLERINYDVVSRTTLIPEDVDYITYNRLTVGEIKLRKSAVDAQYVWVSVNNELLSPSVDYYVTDDKLKVQLVRHPEANDVIDIIHFTAPVSTPKFAYRQFKDMLNRTHFKRLEKSAAKLAQPLNYYDLRIELDDASELSVPNKGQNLPGVIFIEGERIEYFVKEENTLRQLRRGTLGTGVKDTYATDTKVFDQNISKTVPYKDRTLVYNTTADGLTATFEIGYPVASINEIEVFVAGVRLRKTPLDVFDPTVALDSSEGDTTVAADFTFDADTNEITLLDAPAKDTRVTVVKKVGQSWTNEGTTLGDTENGIARFLRAATSELPE